MFSERAALVVYTAACQKEGSWFLGPYCAALACPPSWPALNEVDLAISWMDECFQSLFLLLSCKYLHRLHCIFYQTFLKSCGSGRGGTSRFMIEKSDGYYCPQVFSVDSIYNNKLETLSSLCSVGSTT